MLTSWDTADEVAEVEEHGRPARLHAATARLEARPQRGNQAYEE
jgi:hypothetical protein